MTEKKNHCHYVATYDQAKALLEAREQVLVDNCGCRQPSCKRSHKRLCVWFTQEDRGKGSVDPLTQAQAIELLEYAAKQQAKVVHFSEIRFIGGLEPENLKRVRRRADCMARNSASRS